jgi:hypothetical protein
MTTRTLAGEVTMSRTGFEGALERPGLGSKQLWAGRILSGLSIAFLAMDAGMKLANLQMVKEGASALGYPPETMLPIGVVLLVCTLLYAIPRTAVLGAVLLTGYLGGAIATHVRVGDPLLTHTLFPICDACASEQRRRVAFDGIRHAAQRSAQGGGQRFGERSLRERRRNRETVRGVQ